MKLLIQFLLCGFLLLSFGCNKSDEVLIKLGSAFTLPFQSEVVLKKTDIRIRLVDIADSRCPTQVFCAWAGSAIIKLKIADGDEEVEIEMEKGVGENIDDFATAIYKNYQLLLIEVNPFPETSEKIPQDDYEVVLQINPL